MEVQRWITYLDDMINSEELAFLGEGEKDQIRELFSQGIKHKMKMNFVRKISKSSGSVSLGTFTLKHK